MNYLSDLVELLVAQANAARSARDAATEDHHDFEAGRLMAYYEVVSLMQQQASAFGLAPEALGLDAISPDRDLI